MNDIVGEMISDAADAADVVVVAVVVIIVKGTAAADVVRAVVALMPVYLEYKRIGRKYSPEATVSHVLKKLSEI